MYILIYTYMIWLYIYIFMYLQSIVAVPRFQTYIEIFWHNIPSFTNISSIFIWVYHMYIYLFTLFLRDDRTWGAKRAWKCPSIHDLPIETFISLGFPSHVWWHRSIYIYIDYLFVYLYTYIIHIYIYIYNYHIVMIYSDLCVYIYTHIYIHIYIHI